LEIQEVDKIKGVQTAGRGVTGGERGFWGKRGKKGKKAKNGGGIVQRVEVRKRAKVGKKI